MLNCEESIMNAVHQVHLNTLLSEAEVCCATLYPKLGSFFRAPPVAAEVCGE